MRSPLFHTAPHAARSCAYDRSTLRHLPQAHAQGEPAHPERPQGIQHEKSRTIPQGDRVLPAGHATRADRASLPGSLQPARGCHTQRTVHRQAGQHRDTRPATRLPQRRSHVTCHARSHLRIHQERILPQQQGTTPGGDGHHAPARIRRRGALHHGATHPPARCGTQDSQRHAQRHLPSGGHGSRYTRLQSEPPHRTRAAVVHHPTQCGADADAPLRPRSAS